MFVAVIFPDPGGTGNKKAEIKPVPIVNNELEQQKYGVF